MANKKITQLSALAIADANVIIHENSAGTSTGKATMSALATYIENEITDYSNPANIDSSLGGTSVYTDIRALAGGTSAPTKDLGDLVAHIAGTADNHDAEDITYDTTSDVESALNTLFSRVESGTGVLRRFIYNITSYAKSSSEDYHDGTNMVLTEDLLLETIGIDNTSFSAYQYAISHNIPTVSIYIFTKASNYMENILLTADQIKITYEETYNSVHLSSITITDTNINVGEDVKVIVVSELFKNYIVSPT